jgi:hypothetical protein
MAIEREALLLVPAAFCALAAGLHVLLLGRPLPYWRPPVRRGYYLTLAAVVAIAGWVGAKARGSNAEAILSGSTEGRTAAHATEPCAFEGATLPKVCP